MGSGTGEGYRNGSTTAYYSGATGANNLNSGLRIGAAAVAPFNWFKGHICEIMVFTGKHNSTDRQRVAKYLTNKWVGSPTIGALTLGTLYNNNWVQKGSLSSANRYWWLQMNPTGGTATSVYRHLRHAFGQAVDLGRDAAEIPQNYVHSDTAEFRASSGARFHTRGRRPVNQFELEWQAVSDAKISEFHDQVKNSDVETFFLYAQAEGWQLDSKTLLHCKVDSANTERVSVVNDWNTLKATFTEVE